MADEPRPGRPPAISVEQIEAVVIATLEEIPKNATHWSRKSRPSTAACQSPASAASGESSSSSRT
ncbi:hypothetical protein ACFYMI_36625 [Streptomyces collinus]|uniref:hypothetical protein n=1 Tax=Streptomyces collinus TaxID=42684 RepID=UPI0036A0AE7A